MVLNVPIHFYQTLIKRLHVFPPHVLQLKILAGNILRVLHKTMVSNSGTWTPNNWIACMETPFTVYISATLKAPNFQKKKRNAGLWNKLKKREQDINMLYTWNLYKNIKTTVHLRLGPNHLGFPALATSAVHPLLAFRLREALQGQWHGPWSAAPVSRLYTCYVYRDC